MAAPSVLLTTGPAAAQGSTHGPQALTGVAFPLHTSETRDYGTWAAGDHYKAGFEGGFEFVPYLGPDYPTNQTLAWRTESVRIGEVELATRGPEGREVGGFRYEYDLGGVVEAYDIRAESVEQTFIIAECPSGVGALEVRGRVTTPLRAPRLSAKHSAIVFYGDSDEALVEYGAATAVDADGTHYPMQSSWDGECIRLRLDAPSVSIARFPLVVDPAIVSSSGSQAVGETEVQTFERSPISVCFTRVASASDHDLYFVEHSLNWSFLATRYTDITTANSAHHPDMSLRGESAILVYEQRYGSQTDLRLHSRTESGGGISTTVAALAGTHFSNPSIIGSHSSLTYLVYDRVGGGTSTIRGSKVARRVAASGVDRLEETPFAAPLASPGVGVEPRATLVRTGTGSEFSVCWPETNATTSRILVRSFDALGNPTTNVTTLVSSSSSVFTSPLIAGNNDRALITYRRGPRNIGFNSLVAASFTLNSQWQLVNSRTLAGGQTYANGDLAFDVHTGSTWMACYTVYTGALSQEVHFERLGPRAQTSWEFVPPPGERPLAPAVTFGRSLYSNALPPRLIAPSAFLATWGAGGSTNRVYGESMPYSAEAMSFLVAIGRTDCGGINELHSHVSPSIVGNQNFRVKLSGAPLLSALMIGTSIPALPLDLIGMQGCFLHLDPIATIPAQPEIIRSTAYWPLPDQPSLFGTNVLAQWIWTEPGANALGLVTSSTFQIRFR